MITYNVSRGIGNLVSEIRLNMLGLTSHGTCTYKLQRYPCRFIYVQVVEDISKGDLVFIDNSFMGSKSYLGTNYCGLALSDNIRAGYFVWLLMEGLGEIDVVGTPWDAVYFDGSVLSNEVAELQLFNSFYFDINVIRMHHGG